ARKLLGNSRGHQSIQPRSFDRKTGLAREVGRLAPETTRTLIAHRYGEPDEERVAEEVILGVFDDVSDRISAAARQSRPTSALRKSHLIDIGKHLHHQIVPARKMMQQSSA